jgi:hypothetical protein
MIYSKDEALNYPEIPADWETKTVVGSSQVSALLLQTCAAFEREKRRPCVVALDGYLAVKWDNIIAAIRDEALALNLPVSFLDISWCLRSLAEIDELVRPSLEADRFFGSVHSGKQADFFDPRKLPNLRAWSR